MSNNPVQPPSYEQAMREANSFAGASAPVLLSPEHGTKGPITESGPISMPMPMPPVAAGSPIGPIQHAPSVPPPQPPYGPQPMPMYQMPPNPTTVYVSAPPVGPNPCTLTCPSCHQRVRTTTTVTHSGTAHIICLLMCFLCCWCCSCLPYCMSGFKIYKHECPSCKSYLGTFKA